MSIARYYLSRPTYAAWWVLTKSGDFAYWLAAWAAVITWNIRGKD